MVSNKGNTHLVEPLTEREQEVLGLLAQGKSNRELAESLVLSLHTVKWHNRQIYGKLGATNREEAVAQARALGLVKSQREPALPEHNLPTPVNAFIGRRRELAEAADLLQTTRLLTLTGAAGSGKTRLAIELAREQLPSFPDGVFFVSLASLTDPRLVDQTIANILKIESAKGRSTLETLQDYLAHKQTLLILDNYEHLLEAATVSSNLLSATDRLRLVATSREPLQLRGEQRYPVPPLALPAEGQVSQEEVAQVEAVRLFVLRAQAADPGFQLTDGNLASVVAICRCLDGLPLVLELAAARLGTTSPEMLLERLSNRLGALSKGLRDLPRRQQTLRNTLAWSYDLLSEEEQLLFDRLGVFAGRWTLADAEAVCGQGLPLDVADGLDSLVAKNLVRLVEGPAGQPNYDMLATIREFAVERLQASGEQEGFVERLARHTAALLPAAAPADPRGTGRSAWYAFLEAELDNIRTALAYFLDHGQVEPTQQIIDQVYYYWGDRLVEEAGVWLNRLLALLGDKPTAARAKALFWLACLYLLGYDNRRAATLLEASVQCWQACGDQRGLFWALCNVAAAHRALGDYERMRQARDQLMPLAEALGDSLTMCAALFWSAFGTTDFGKARDNLRRCQELALQEGLLGLANQYKGWLADTEMRLGNYDTAVAMLRECEAAERQMGRQYELAYVLLLLGEAEIRRGQLEEARRFLAEGLEMVRGFLEVDLPPYFYERFAPLATAQGDFERAAQLFAAAEAARELPGGTALHPEYRPAYQQDVAAVRAGLTEEAFAAAWQRGRAMSIEEATAYALGR